MIGRPAVLVLQTGEVFSGVGCGAEGMAIGEVVFNTSLSGYQEVLTDPSYAGQLVTMTSVHIGNYGVNPADVESAKVQPAGFIVRDLCRRPSNYRSRQPLQDYLTEAGVTAIKEVDTRALTRRIRDGGAVMGLIAHDADSSQAEALLARLRAEPDYGERDFVEQVSCKMPMRVVRVEPEAEPDAGQPLPIRLVPAREMPPTDLTRHVVVVDFGVKYSILRNLLERGADLTLMPSSASAEQVLARGPGAVLLSNGPGDPARLTSAVAEVTQLLGQTPVFGICLGHQLLARAVGASTFKLKYGHRGSNQPVLDVATGGVAITSQNHGYAVAADGLPDDVAVTHTNLNDGTVEGLSHRSLKAVSVQYHPEAGPGPRDARAFFDQVVSVLDGV